MQKIGSLLVIFTSKLNKIKCEYMITGSVASMYYGEPRYTHDIDLVFNISHTQLTLLEQEFPLSEFYFPPIEVVKLELNRSLRGHFNIIHHESGFKVDVYTLGCDPLLRWGLMNKRKVEFDNSIIYVAPPEYVIIQKMIYWDEGGSEKHIRDISAMLMGINNKIDKNLISSKLLNTKQRNKFNELLLNI